MMAVEKEKLGMARATETPLPGFVKMVPLSAIVTTHRTGGEQEMLPRSVGAKIG